MSLNLDQAVKDSGTRFRIYVLPPYIKSALSKKSETITISIPPSKMKKGPADSRMYIVDALNKKPYDDNQPPYTGQSNPPVKPGADGHFDRITLTSRIDS